MNPGILVGAGVLLGSVGVKALTSERAKKVYVKGLVAGMKAKDGVQSVVDEARAQFDDIVAEASYVKECEEGVHAAAEVDASDSEEPALGAAPQNPKAGADETPGEGGRVRGDAQE